MDEYNRNVIASKARGRYQTGLPEVSTNIITKGKGYLKNDAANEVKRRKGGILNASGLPQHAWHQESVRKPYTEEQNNGIV
jgi:hypothetical protein